MYLAGLILPAHLTEEELERLGPALEGLNVGYYVDRVEADNHQSSWLMKWITVTSPDLAHFTDRVNIWAAAQNIALCITPSNWEIEEIPQDIDWLAESYAGFEPFSVGSFYIYGSHHSKNPPKNMTPLKIDAATAFGSGDHGTTAGCLEFLQELKAKTYSFDHILDMGCGSGILAIAARKLWQTEILAVDIEEEAIRVTRRHMRINDIPNEGIQCAAGEGFALPLITERSPFDLILANILAGTLKEMAADMARVSKLNSCLLLSGILIEQSLDIQQHYKRFGFELTAEKQREGWSTLLMTKTSPARA